MKDCVIFDLDGTLTDCSHRLHHIKKSPPDWPAFFAGCVDDNPNDTVIRLLRFFIGMERIIICSGRPDSHRTQTIKWLADHGVAYNRLMMRQASDHRPDVVVKKEMLDTLRAEGFQPWLAIDDRPSVVKMWRDNGVPCLAVDDRNWNGETNIHTGTSVIGKTLLTLLIGPPRSGKSLWLTSDDELIRKSRKDILGEWWPVDIGWVVSRKNIKYDMFGMKDDPSMDGVVTTAVEGLVSARLRYGMPVIVDDRHLRKRERIRLVGLAPEGTRVRYLVFSDGQSALAEDQRQVVLFNAQLKDILAGDGLPNVDVILNP